jgi:hypothetical protein
MISSLSSLEVTLPRSESVQQWKTGLKQVKACWRRIHRCKPLLDTFLTGTILGTARAGRSLQPDGSTPPFTGQTFDNAPARDIICLGPPFIIGDEEIEKITSVLPGAIDAALANCLTPG